jgi:Tfp pilus assembly protein PilF
VRALYRSLVARAAQDPAHFVNNEAGMIAAGRLLLEKSATSAAGLAVLELAVERAPGSYRAHEALADAYRKAGVHDRAAAESREATRLAPLLVTASTRRAAQDSPR